MNTQRRESEPGLTVVLKTGNFFFHIIFLLEVKEIMDILRESSLEIPRIYFEEINIPDSMNVSGCCFAAVHFTSETSFIIRCVYSPPRNSNYVWPFALFCSLLNTLSSMLPMVSIIIAGHINLPTVNWDEISSNEAYEPECVDIFLDFNINQLNKTNNRILDVCLSNSR